MSVDNENFSRRLRLNENNLRASFVVIPVSPSLVDYVTDFSTWRPETIKLPPVRTWPSVCSSFCELMVLTIWARFPLGTPTRVSVQSVADRALDSFGISVPLLEFHEFPSKCVKNHDQDALEDSRQFAGGSENLSDEEADRVELNQNLENGDVFVFSDVAKHPQHAVKRHPFVVTRYVLQFL
jgi:hypothetical protein